MAVLNQIMPIACEIPFYMYCESDFASYFNQYLIS